MTPDIRIVAPFVGLALLLSLPATGHPGPIPRHLPGWAVRVAAGQALDEVHGCYVEHVPAEGRVGNGDNARVSFRFSPQGRVDAVSWVDTTVTQASARACILEALQKVRAPIASERPTTVEVWYGLSSKREATTAKVADNPAQRLTSSSIVDAASAKMKLFIACYEARLDERPALSGRVKLRVTVGSAGKVTSVEVLESLDPKVDACVAGHARSLTFPAPGEDAPVIATIPITFGAQ